MKAFAVLALVLGFAANAADRSCADSPPEWCAPQMVHLVISDDHGEMAVRQENATTTSFARPSWKESLVFSVRRVAGHRLELQVRRQGAGSTKALKEATLKKGDSLVLRCGKELPADFLRGGGTRIAITDDE